MFCLLMNPNGPQGARTYESPDGQLQVQIVTVNKSHEDRIEIRKKDGVIVQAQDYSSPDMEHGTGVCHAGWTRDSQFFVFSTSYSGGHQPWARPTYFYSRRENQIRSLDKFVGPVVRCDFILKAPDIVVTRKLAPDGSAEGEKVQVTLSKLQP